MKTSLWVRIRQVMLALFLIGVFFQIKQPPAAQAAPQLPPLQPNIPSFNRGDLLVTAYSGPLERIDPTTGAVLQTLNSQGDDFSSEMCFDASGDLYVVVQGSPTQLGAGVISKFDASGNLINATFISGLNDPLSCVVDAADDLYVGTNAVNTSSGLTLVSF